MSFPSRDSDGPGPPGVAARGLAASGRRRQLPVNRRQRGVKSLEGLVFRDGSARCGGDACRRCVDGSHALWTSLPHPPSALDDRFRLGGLGAAGCPFLSLVTYTRTTLDT
jgi:hypothetical protein